MPVSAYVARIRAAVGTELLLPSASVLLYDDAGRLLLARHRGHHDGWGLLGGAVEPGESPAEAAVRETREEAGIEIRRLRPIAGHRVGVTVTGRRLPAGPATGPPIGRRPARL